LQAHPEEVPWQVALPFTTLPLQPFSSQDAGFAQGVGVGRTLELGVDRTLGSRVELTLVIEVDLALVTEVDLTLERMEVISVVTAVSSSSGKSDGSGCGM
jgi:hypothetical protein